MPGTGEADFSNVWKYSDRGRVLRQIQGAESDAVLEYRELPVTKKMPLKPFVIR
jgi:hypothetical protein